MTDASRLSTGVPGFDQLLGGGLMPGTLTVVAGAAGIGKTQFGLQFAAAGEAQEGRRGIFFDMTSRGDSQSHHDYAQRMFQWALSDVSPDKHPDLENFFALERQYGDYLKVFAYQGRRVTRKDLDWEAWREWKSELVAKLGITIAFFYGNFLRGCRRAVIDGVEPTDTPSDSIQFELFEYVYHQILRKDPEWVARDLFRQLYRENAHTISQHVYDPTKIGCLLLYTCHETMLEDLIERRLDEGDMISNANTVILMGKIRDGRKLGRALYVSKHRGSQCSEEIVPYQINEQGLFLSEPRASATGGEDPTA